MDRSVGTQDGSTWRFTLRGSGELRDKLTKIAEREHRTLNSLVLHVLSRYVDLHEQEKDGRS